MSLAPANPVEGLRPPDEGPQDPKREKRSRMKLWDRIKFLLLFTVIFFLLVWASMANNPILPFQDAVRQQLFDSSWLLVLAGLEVLRQVHYLISENWSGYHRFWVNKVFGGSERIAQRRLSAWTRFRLARVFKWLVFFGLFFFVASKFLNTSPVLAAFALPALIWSALPFIVQIVLIVSLGILQFVAIFWFMSRGGVDVYYPDDIKTRFRDVWGQDHVLARVRENIVFLERPAEIEDKGGYVPGGILLWGPPGTGKTLMAEAVAGETGKPYVFVDPGAFINMFFGVGILKVKSLFRKLRKLALRYGGVIVFFDEADSLGNRGIATGGQFPRGMSTDRSGITGCHGFSYLSPQVQSLLLTGMSGGDPKPAERRRVIPAGAGMNGMGGMMGAGTLQALLTELSGLKKPRGFINRYVRRLMGMRPKPPPKYRILVMMATNMPEALDEALLRPGRIDRIYKVGYPSKAGRVRTYEGYFGKVRNQLTDDDLDKLATITPYATGASMKDLVNESLITAIRDGRDTISWPDVVKAKHLKELGPPEDVEYIERERHAVAIHEACHAVVAFHSRRHADIDIATIEKGSDYLGMVKSIPPEDQFTSWRSEFRADIFTALASLAGERMFFEGDSTSGVSGDLESATRVASHMEGTFGMGSTVSSVATARQLDTGTPGGGIPIGGRDSTEMVRARLADRIEDNLAALLEETRQILERHRRDVMVLAHALETYKTLSGEDVTAVLRGHAGPLVDGRPYLNADLYKEIEAYHRAAVVAHMNHSHIQLALPPVPSYQDPAWAGPRDPFSRPGAAMPGSTLPTGTATEMPNGGGTTAGYAMPPTEAPNGGGSAPGLGGARPDGGNPGGVGSPFGSDDHN
jgi:cell division protease FtsH